MYVLSSLPPYIHYYIQQALAGVSPGVCDPSMFNDREPDTVSSHLQQPGEELCLQSKVHIYVCRCVYIIITIKYLSMLLIRLGVQCCLVKNNHSCTDLTIPA